MVVYCKDGVRDRHSRPLRIRARDLFTRPLPITRERADTTCSAGHIIGVRRFVRMPTVTTTKLRLRITTALACPTLSAFEI